MPLKLSGNIIVNGNKISEKYQFKGRFKITCLECKHFWFVQGSVYSTKCQKCGCDAVSISSEPKQGVK